MDPEEEQREDDSVTSASEEDDDEWDALEEEDSASQGDEQDRAAPPRGSSAAQQDATRSFKNVYRRKQIPPGGRAWYGHVWRGKQQLKTSFFHTAEEAARAVDRYLYKVRGPEACNFPVAPELAAELDALTVEQVHEQFKLQRRSTPRTGKFTGVSFNQARQKWQATVKATLVGGQPKSTDLGYSASEEQAAERASAGAYVLGDRCITQVPLGRFSNLAPAQGRALAVEVLGQAKVAQLEELVRGGQVGTKVTGKRRPARSEDEESSSSSSSSSSEESEDNDKEEDEEEQDEEEEERVPPAHRRRGAAAGAAAPMEGVGGGGTAAVDAAHGFKHVSRRKDVPPGGKAWCGQIHRSTYHVSTTHHRTPEEAARAVDRYLYKLDGPEACNFLVTPALAAELDALTVEQIQEQFKQQGRTRTATSKFKGVSVDQSSSKWQARVRVRLGSGQTKQTSVGCSVSEEQAAERVSAAAYVLGDRCLTKVPLGRFSNLAPAQGRALAVEVLGQAKVARLEELVRGTQAGTKGTAKRRRARSDSGSSSESSDDSEDEQEDREGGAPVPRHGGAETGGGVAGADEGDGAAACGRQMEAESGSQQQRVDSAAPTHDATASWSVDALMAQARASITGEMVQDAWMDVRESLEERSASSSAACGPIDTGLGTAPHPAVRAGVAGLSEAFQTPEAVAAAWAGAQAEAEAFAERLGDEGLLDTSSLHRLAFLLAYSILWLWQADELYLELSEPQRQAVLQPQGGGRV